MKLTIDQVLIIGADVCAAPLQIDGVDLFERLGHGDYRPIPEVWEVVAADLTQMRNEAGFRNKEHWREMKAGLVAGDEAARVSFNVMVSRAQPAIGMNVRRWERAQAQLREFDYAEVPFVPRNAPVEIGDFNTCIREDICAACGVAMITYLTRSHTPVCSTHCETALTKRRADDYRDYKREQMQRRRAKDRTRTCEVCGETFNPKRDDALVCSVKCRQKKAYRSRA